MRVPVHYLVLPTPAFCALNERFEIRHPAADKGRLWQSSDHHGHRPHTRDQIEDAAWMSFLGDFDLEFFDAEGVDVRPFLQACIALGVNGCFDIQEVAAPESADELLRAATELRERAISNIDTLR